MSLRIGLDGRIAEQPDAGAHGGQGRAELVGDGREQVGAEALQLLEQDRSFPPERAALLRNCAKSRLARLGEGDASALRYSCPPCGGGCDEQRYVEATGCPGCGMPMKEAAGKDAEKQRD